MKRRGRMKGPRMLKYTEGGIVHAASKGIEAVGRVFGTEKARAIKRAERDVANEQDQDKKKPASAIDRGGQLKEQERKALEGS